MRRGLAGRVGRAGPSTVMANFAFCVVWPTDARRPGRAGLLAHQRRDRSGPRWGRDRAVNDWSTADNHGRPQGIIFQLPRRSTAGHGRQAIRSDTEGVTGSIPVAPTTRPLTSAFDTCLIPPSACGGRRGCRRAHYLIGLRFTDLGEGLMYAAAEAPLGGR